MVCVAEEKKYRTKQNIWGMFEMKHFNTYFKILDLGKGDLYLEKIGKLGSPLSC